MSPAITLRDVAAAYGGTEVLRDVALEAAPGEFVAIVGRSGVGKTTLLRVAAGLLAPRSGEVLIHGSAPALAQRRKAIGLVFQDASLHPWLTVTGNVALPLRVNGGAGGGARDGAVLEWVSRVGLAPWRSAYPRELSGGMRQRVALARALVLRPEVLLMDEPLGALDELTREEMRDEVVALWAETRSTALYVTHDIEEAVQLADRVLVLAGRPATIAAEVPVDLPRPRTVAARRGAAFLDTVDAVRRALV